MARGVENADPRAAQVEDVPVPVSERIRARHEVELLLDRRPKGRVDVRREPVDAHEGIQGLDAREVCFVEMPGNVGIKMGAGDVVLMTVAKENAIDGRRDFSARNDSEGGIDDHAFTLAPDPQGIAVGILPAARSEEDSGGAEVEIDQRFASFGFVAHLSTILPPPRG